MSPLMQTICDDLRAYALDRYIDGFERDAYAAELAQLYGALSAALPEPQAILEAECDGTL